jgi:hypothetical protein
VTSRRREFLAFVDRLAEGKSSREDWDRFAVTHYGEAEIEAARVSLVRVAVHAVRWSWPGVPDEVRAEARVVIQAMGAAETHLATTTAIPVSALAAVSASATRRKTLVGHEKDEFPIALARHGRALEVFEHSGLVLGTALAYLRDRRGLDLTHSRHDEIASAITRARGSSFFILGEEHLPLSGALTDVGASPEELGAFFDAVNPSREGPEVGEAMREGIRFLQRALEAVAPGTVVLVAIL